jgi:peptidase E
MTKYILHGGAWQKEAGYKDFFLEMVKGLASPINVLCVYFAREKKEWSSCLAEDKAKFTLAAPSKKLNVLMADTSPTIFTQQIKKADIIYLRGGDSHILQKYLEKINNIENLWRDKVVGGSSAGALVLSKYYFENDDNTFNKGLGILPVKIICHYTKDMEDKLKKLRESGEKSKIYAIPEEKFIVIKR